MNELVNPVRGLEYKLPLDKHVAESVWQRCNCQSCQEHRHRLETLGRQKINFETFRNKDEKY
jgi:hypothetical protein